MGKKKIAYKKTAKRVASSPTRAATSMSATRARTPRDSSKRVSIDHTSEIDQLNKEISNNNRLYTSLLEQSKHPNADLNAIRSDLVRLAKEMERSSEMLFALKKRHSRTPSDRFKL
jgi:predicted  nucleic acid-binding Zn-ribbon protein